MRYVLVAVALICLLGLVISMAAMGREPLAALLALLCLLTFSVAGGLASLLFHIKARDGKLLAAIKDIASSNAAIAETSQRRQDTP